MEADEIITDPMELSEGHFEQDDINQEKAFKDQFNEEESFNVDPGGMEEGTETSNENIDTETGKSIIEEEKDEKFEFDQSLAESEKAELEELNQKLGSNFPDLKSLRDAIKSNETKEETNDIEEEQQFISYFESVLEYSDKDVVIEDAKMLVQQKGVESLKDPEVLERIENEAALLEENGSLPYAARSIRSSINNILDKKRTKINTFQENQKTTIEQQQTEFKEKVQESVNNIYKEGQFLGIKPSKADLLEAYTDVTKNKHIDHLRANPDEAIEYVLFKKYRQEIVKKLGKPGFKAGVKNTLEELGMVGSKQTGKPVITDDKSGAQEELSYFGSFIK